MNKSEIVLRKSQFGDYIAVDLIDEETKLIKTIFYIQNNRMVEVHWAIPSNERVDYPVVYDEWWDRFMLKMEGGKLFCKWLNSSFLNEPKFYIVPDDQIVDFRFQYAHKILEPIKIQ